MGNIDGFGQYKIGGTGGGGGSTTIYTGDGNISGDRQVSLNASGTSGQLYFKELAQCKIESGSDAYFANDAIVNVANNSNDSIMAVMRGNTQVLINGGSEAGLNSNSEASAALQVDSTTQGLLVPRMTGAQVEAISAPVEGLLVFATNAGTGEVTGAGFWYWNGAGWQRPSSDNLYNSDGSLSGSRALNGDTNDLNFQSLQTFTVTNDNTTTLDENAILKLQSTEKYFLQPVMTGAQAEAISSPNTGAQLYASNAGAGDISAAGWYGYDGANWVDMRAGGSGSGGKMVSTASFQGWRESPTGFGSPMATWGAGGSGAGGLNDLGFWVAPFACTVQNFSARWGHNASFVNGGNNPIIGLYKITDAAWTGSLDIGNPSSWGSALQTITIPNTGATNDYWKLTSAEASLSLAAGDAIAIFMDVTPTGSSSADSVIWLFVNYTYS
jgi:hypothetical protein